MIDIKHTSILLTVNINVIFISRIENTDKTLPVIQVFYFQTQYYGNIIKILIYIFMINIITMVIYIN